MNNIKLLDCTLRDGGYINNWNFSNRVIKRILQGLSNAKIDIVECGFLSDCIYNADMTLYNDVIQISNILPKSSVKYVAMVALGEKEISYERIPKNDGKSIFGIRLTFHKSEIDRAFSYARNIIDKGYEVFMQPVGTSSYTDIELLKLVQQVNELCPYAFYIVDTLGNIKVKELIRLFHMVDNNLSSSIKIGFHSHNNLQLAFANAQELIQIFTHREIIIDASVNGMGRGAGNLCTELIADFMNENLETSYNITALLEIIDKYLIEIKETNSWGYSIPYYISAVNGCHPNYGTYLINKQTINVRDIEKIISKIPSEKRIIYDKELISFLYQEYQEYLIDDTEEVQKLKQLFADKRILLLAPGHTLKTESNKIKEFIETFHPYIISINFDNEYYKNDMVFISNLKRFDEFDMAEYADKKEKLIITSNIKLDNVANVSRINYSSYLNQDKLTFDDAGLMILNLLHKCGVRDIALAGFDGFISKYDNDSISSDKKLSIEPLTPEEKTNRIREQIQQIQNDINIIFVTSSQYDKEYN